ncbi:MAG TPA: PEP/pyruvate-binding domain-containing protein [Candidatus Limnocylindrales bacterium]|nr:PEP/pyruvate-binding domain-containing protein [Candidatus Limnocylindrales bacterium]
MPTPASVSSHDPYLATLGAASIDADLGGKGASLDRLARLGHPIPPGFCLTAAAFRAYLAAAAEPDALATAIAALPDEAARCEIVAALDATAMPPAVGESIRAGLAALCTELRGISSDPADPSGDRPTFAVRSSALDEDGVDASFAGLHETELGRTADEVEDAVRRCWRSLWSTAAVGYRARRGLPFDGIAMAVVVQALVPAEASVVVFTRHPVSGRDDVLINAIRGLGEPLVSGTATPETIVVERSGRTIIERIPGDHGRRLFAHAGIPVEMADPSTDPVLTDGAACDLAGIALDIEAGLGRPVDIEAVRYRDRWLLLQARPITTGR